MGELNIVSAGKTNLFGSEVPCILARKVDLPFIYSPGLRIPPGYFDGKGACRVTSYDSNVDVHILEGIDSGKIYPVGRYRVRDGTREVMCIFPDDSIQILDGNGEILFDKMVGDCLIVALGYRGQKRPGAESKRL